MQVHFGSDQLNVEWPGAVVCVGTFDGVHLGHQEVVKAAVRLAAGKELPCIIVTFDRHPAAILDPERAPRAIASQEENLRVFATLGAALTLVLVFNQELSQTSAETFFNEILKNRLRACSVVVGHDFAFGNGREGKPEWLEKRIETLVVPPFEIEGKRVSSSSIRTAVEAGEVQQGAKWLGRPFEMPGVVIAGQRLGRQIGYPTLNLARSFRQITPEDGIYAGRCDTVRGKFKAAISIGKRPAVGGQERTIEAFLLDYPGQSLYGTAVTLEFLFRIREERNFESLDLLKAQIARDVEQVDSCV